MTRLDWTISQSYGAGVDRGVFFPADGPAEVWNGLVSVTENPIDLYERVRYLDGQKIAQNRREDSFSASLSAFSYPASFLRNPRTPFGLSYRVQTAKGYRIHLVYNAMALISSRSFGQEDSSKPVDFQITTRPVVMSEALVPSAHLIVDTSQAWAHTLSDLEDILYGAPSTQAHLPSPDEVWELFEETAVVRVVDNGDGSATIIGPDNAVSMTEETVGLITWPSVTYLGGDTYKIASF